MKRGDPVVFFVRGRETLGRLVGEPKGPHRVWQVDTGGKLLYFVPEVLLKTSPKT